MNSSNGAGRRKAGALSGAQAKAAHRSPRRLPRGRDYITPVKPNTIAKSIAIGPIPPMAPMPLDIAAAHGSDRRGQR